MVNLKTCILILPILLMLGSTAAQAGGSIGIDYYETDLAVTELITGRSATISFSGPGISLGWNLSDDWTLNFSHSSNDGQGVSRAGDSFVRELSVESESSTSALSIGYFGESFWLNLGASATDDQQHIRAVNPNTDVVTRDSNESQDGRQVGIDIGKDWFLGNWSPSLSASVNYQTRDIEREFNVGSTYALEETLTGTEIGLAASIFYFTELSENIALVPSAGLFYQHNLDGEIRGNARFSRTRNSDIQTTSRNYNGDIQGEELLSGNLSLSLITGDWIWSAGTQGSLSSDVDDQSWFAALSYNF